MELNQEKFVMMLDHMLGHNKHHTEDLVEMAANADRLNRSDVAELINQAKQLQDQANQILEKSLDLLK